MSREAIASVRDIAADEGRGRRWRRPLGWAALASSLAATTLLGVLPPSVGVLGLAAAVVAVSVLEARKGSADVATDPRALAFAASGDGLWDYDVARGRIEYDDRCAVMLGYPKKAVASHLGAWGKLVHPDDLAPAREALDAFLEGRVTRYAVTVRLKAADGRWCRVLDRAQVVARDASGRPTRLVGIHRILPDVEAGRGADALTLETASIEDIMQRALARRGEPRVELGIRSADDLGVAWVDGVTLTRGIARLIDAVAEQVPNGTVIPVRTRAPRDLGMVGFSLGLPPCASVDPESRHIEAGRSLLRTSGGRLRVRHDQLVIELPSARGRSVDAPDAN